MTSVVLQVNTLLRDFTGVDLEQARLDLDDVDQERDTVNENVGSAKSGWENVRATCTAAPGLQRGAYLRVATDEDWRRFHPRPRQREERPGPHERFGEPAQRRSRQHENIPGHLEVHAHLLVPYFAAVVRRHFGKE